MNDKTKYSLKINETTSPLCWISISMLSLVALVLSTAISLSLFFGVISVISFFNALTSAKVIKLDPIWIESNSNRKKTPVCIWSLDREA